jgi:8-oxo-dGTP pyrophosphatase MutT (NUDIX family)
MVAGPAGPAGSSYSDRMGRPLRSSRSAGHPRRLMPTVEETSAGGIVVDVDGVPPRAAVIARVNRAGRVEWCLPKGHLESGETPEQAAVREIAEETGILGRVVGSLGTIDYWFSAEGRRVHKMVHHYLLLAIGGTLTVEDDPDQEAVDVAWVPLTELGALLAFPNERKIAKEASAKLADSA